MLALSIALLALGGGDIALHVEESGELEQHHAFELANAIARAIEARTSSVARVEDPAWWGCPEDSEDRCVREIRGRTGSSEIVLLRMYGGLRSIRVIAERVRGANATIDLARTSTAWSGSLDALAAQLFPATTPRASLVLSTPADVPRASSAVLPWVLFGGAAALGIGGAIFTAGNVAARSDLESGVHGHSDYEALSSRQTRDGALAIGLFAGAGITAAVGVILFVLRD